MCSQGNTDRHTRTLTHTRALSHTRTHSTHMHNDKNTHTPTHTPHTITAQAKLLRSLADQFSITCNADLKIGQLGRGLFAQKVRQTKREKKFAGV